MIAIPNKPPARLCPQEVYHAAMGQFVRWYGADYARGGACIYVTQCVIRELTLRGRRAVLQAGSMWWPMATCAIDDKTTPTHFCYEFGLTAPFSKQALAEGRLPEIHVWAALPDEGVLVDFSTGYLKELAERCHGLRWTAPDPPQYVWGAPPPGVIYAPTVEAIRFAWKFILEKMA